MGEGAAGVVCEFGEEGLGFGFGERSHFALDWEEVKGGGKLGVFGFWIFEARKNEKSVRIKFCLVL